MQLDITPEKIAEMATQKVADEIVNTIDLDEMVRSKVETAIEDRLTAVLNKAVDDKLKEELERLITQTITPVDIWGEKTGEPTNIRAALATRARDFWMQKIDKDGRESGYYGTPRWEVLMKQFLTEEFNKAVKTNAEVVVAEFKKQLLGGMQQISKEHLDKLIKA